MCLRQRSPRVMTLLTTLSSKTGSVRVLLQRQSRIKYTDATLTPSLATMKTILSARTRSTSRWGSSDWPSGIILCLIGRQRCLDLLCIVTRLCWTTSIVKNAKKSKTLVSSKCLTTVQVMSLTWHSSNHFPKANIKLFEVSYSLRSSLTICAKLSKSTQSSTMSTLRSWSKHSVPCWLKLRWSSTVQTSCARNLTISLSWVWLKVNQLSQSRRAKDTRHVTRCSALSNRISKRRCRIHSRSEVKPRETRLSWTPRPTTD